MVAGLVSITACGTTNGSVVGDTSGPGLASAESQQWVEGSHQQRSVDSGAPTIEQRYGKANAIAPKPSVIPRCTETSRRATKCREHVQQHRTNIMLIGGVLAGGLVC